MDPRLLDTIKSINAMTGNENSETEEPSSFGSTDSTDTSGPVTDSNYRCDILARNGVRIVIPITPLLDHIPTIVKAVLVECCPSKMNKDKAAEIREQILDLGEAVGTRFYYAFIAMDVLPPEPRRSQCLQRGLRVSFDKTTPPRAAMQRAIPTAIQSILSPKPDAAYGYLASSFTRDQMRLSMATLNGVEHTKCFKPAMDLHWPFLVFQSQTPAAGGNIFMRLIYAQVAAQHV